MARGGDEDAIRRPVSGGARCDSAGGSAVHFPAQISKDGDAADGVQHMMLQEDIEQDADDGIAFHNHQSATVHPELTSWIDVALSTAGLRLFRIILLLWRSNALQSAIRPCPAALAAFAQGCALSVMCSVRYIPLHLTIAIVCHSWYAGSRRRARSSSSLVSVVDSKFQEAGGERATTPPHRCSY